MYYKDKAHAQLQVKWFLTESDRKKQNHGTVYVTTGLFLSDRIKLLNFTLANKYLFKLTTKFTRYHYNNDTIVFTIEDYFKLIKFETTSTIVIKVRLSTHVIYSSVGLHSADDLKNK